MCDDPSRATEGLQQAASAESAESAASAASPQRNTLDAHPAIDPTVFVAAGARIMGDVAIGADSSVWFNAVIRGDTERIRIGRETNVQDLAILHADPGFPCQIGNRVTIGHAAIVHGAVVEDEVMVGMRAVVMNGAKIGRGSIIAAGAVITEGTQIPAGSVVMGMPGKVRRTADDSDKVRIARAAEHYVENALKALGKSPDGDGRRGADH